VEASAGGKDILNNIARIDVSKPGGIVHNRLSGSFVSWFLGGGWGAGGGRAGHTVFWSPSLILIGSWVGAVR